MISPGQRRAESVFGLRALDFCLIVLPAAVIAFHPLANNDLPMHLAIGEWILREGAVPAADPFSFTAPSGAWVPHEWLAGVGFALVHSFGGAQALVWLTVVGAALLAALAARVYAGLKMDSSELLIWVPVLWLLAGSRIMLRPHLFAEALPFMVWWTLLAARTRPLLLLLLPVTMALWVNLHGSFYLGIAIIALDLILCGRAHAARPPLRYGILATAAGALFVQPYGLAGLVEPFTLTSNDVFMIAIDEWAPPFGPKTIPASKAFRSTVEFALSIPWLLLVAIGLLRNVRGIPISYRLFVLGAALLYLRHQRYLAFFALASLPCMPFALVRPEWSAFLKHWLPRGVALAAAGAFLFGGFPTGWADTRKGGSGFAGNLPVAEVTELVERGTKGNVLCEYDYGGVVAWLSKGTLKVSMDSRNTVYDSTVFLRHQAALDNTALEKFAGARAELAALLAQCSVVLIHDPAKDRYRTTLCGMLDSHAEWVHFIPRPRTDGRTSPARIYLRRER